MRRCASKGLLELNIPIDPGTFNSAIRRRLSSYVRQGAGRPSNGSTGTTVSIFLGRDSEARELRAELGGHSFALTARR